MVDLAPQDDRRTGWPGASGLHVEMLGSFVVRIDDRDVTEALVGRSRTVFQYLLLAGAPVPRDVLIDVCWPEFDVERVHFPVDWTTLPMSSRSVCTSSTTRIVGTNSLQWVCYAIRYFSISPNGNGLTSTAS